MLLKVEVSGVLSVLVTLGLDGGFCAALVGLLLKVSVLVRFKSSGSLCAN